MHVVQIASGCGQHTRRLWGVFSPVMLLALFLISCGPTTTTHPDESSIRAFVDDRYLGTWSRGDMEGYRACFDEQARIRFIKKSGQVSNETLTDFLEREKRVDERRVSPLTARSLKIKTQGDTKVVQVMVTIAFTKGTSEWGHATDFLMLRRDQDGWKILSLVYYGEWR